MSISSVRDPASGIDYDPVMSNVDPKELAKFSELAHKWWDPESEFRPLHEINPLRLEWMVSFTGPLAGQKAVDVGCGGGILSEGIARQGAQVLGIDLAEKSLKVAQLHAMESGLPVQYRTIAAEDLAAERPGGFDVVACMEMLEHVPDPASIVQACSALAKPGGWVFFSTLNRNAKAFMLAIVGAEYLLKMLPAGTHDYAKFIQPHELATWCRHAGLVPQSTRGLHYNPLTRRYSTGNDIGVNYMLACRKPSA